MVFDKEPEYIMFQAYITSTTTILHKARAKIKKLTVFYAMEFLNQSAIEYPDNADPATFLSPSQPDGKCQLTHGSNKVITKTMLNRRQNHIEITQGHNQKWIQI